MACQCLLSDWARHNCRRNKASRCFFCGWTRPCQEIAFKILLWVWGQGDGLVGPNLPSLPLHLVWLDLSSSHTSLLLSLQIVNLIEETGHFNVTNTTFDFDLFSLDETTVRKLQSYLEAVATWRLALEAGCFWNQKSHLLVPGNKPVELGLLTPSIHPKHCLREQPSSVNAQPAALFSSKHLYCWVCPP